MKKFNKNIKIGTYNQDGKTYSILVELTIKTENREAETITHKNIYEYQTLSISGSIFRTSNDCIECGQIYDTLKNDKNCNFTITARELKRILYIWKNYHLNDLNPNCIHQEFLRWGNKDLSLSKLKLKYELLKDQNAINDKIASEMKENGHSNINEAQRKLLNLKYTIEVPTEDVAEYPEYELESTEVKKSSWTHQNEHPEGVLNRECPECGYKYGSKWLVRELPTKIVDEIINIFKNN